MLKRLIDVTVVSLSVLSTGFLMFSPITAQAQSGYRICATLGAQDDGQGKAQLDKDGNPIYVVGLISKRNKNEPDSYCRNQLRPKFHDALKGKGLILNDWASGECNDIGNKWKSTNWNSRADNIQGVSYNNSGDRMQYPDICKHMGTNDTILIQRKADQAGNPILSLEKKKDGAPISF